MRVKPGFEKLQLAYNDLFEKFIHEKDVMTQARILICMQEMYRVLHS